MVQCVLPALTICKPKASHVQSAERRLAQSSMCSGAELAPVVARHMWTLALGLSGCAAAHVPHAVTSFAFELWGPKLGLPGLQLPDSRSTGRVSYVLCEVYVWTDPHDLLHVHVHELVNRVINPVIAQAFFDLLQRVTHYVILNGLNSSADSIAW